MASKEINKTETESSIGRALEAEDKVRFGLELKTNTSPKNDVTDLKCIKTPDKPRKSNHKSSHKVGDSRKSEKTRKAEKLPKMQKASKNKTKKSKMIKFHSDSELDSVYRETKNRIERRNDLISKMFSAKRRDSKSAKGVDLFLERKIGSKEKAYEKSGTESSPEKSPNEKKNEGKQDRMHGSKEASKEIKKGKIYEDMHYTDKEIHSYPIMENNQKQPRPEKCDIEDCSHNKMLNLLLEYFKELTKEVCEFREEKKKMREQICDLEVNVEKLTVALEAQAKEIKKLTEKLHKGDNDIDVYAKQDLKREVRSMLEDVHKNYHRQIIEHELRMKFVQERAEQDIQNLMKNIVDNYVELKELKGKQKDIGSIIGKHFYRKSKVENCFGHETGKSTNPILLQGDATMPSGANTAFYSSEQLSSFPRTQHDSKDKEKPSFRNADFKKYEFYFPRTENKFENNTSKAETKMYPVETYSDLHYRNNKTDEAKHLTFVEESSMKINSSFPEAAPSKTMPEPDKNRTSAYLEWKQSLREKLTQRSSLERSTVISKDCENSRNVT